MNSINNKNVKNFIKFIKEELEKFGGKLIIKPVSFDKNRSSDGEFSESDVAITCFYDPSSYYWVGVLAHEYGHFLQFKNREKIWDEFVEKANEIEDIEKIFKNKQKYPINKRKRLGLVKKIIPIELKADKKSVFLIKKFNLPVDTVDFVKNSNIILYKYIYWGEKGKWPSFSLKASEASINTKNLKISSFKRLSHYLDIKNIPEKIFYLFENNISQYS